MRILFVAAEVSPLAKVGGLGDVIGSLPKALNDLGHDVRIIIPRYGSLDLSQHQTSLLRKGFEIPIKAAKTSADLLITTLENKTPVYLIENSQYFGGDEIYGKNELERFFFFSKMVSEILPRLDWQPEIVHCHDWHTALIPLWLRKFGYHYVSLFTIHNLAYQGDFDEAFLVDSGMKEYWDKCPLEASYLPFNFMSQGILWADLLTTVSETYAKEIVTPEYGNGLDSLLRYRQKDLFGIINGVDYDEYNPSTDQYITASYDSSTLERRLANKLDLQKRLKLTQSAKTPLLGMVQRLDQQKGVDLLEKAIVQILTKAKAQIVIQGKGRPYYESQLRQMATKNPHHLAVEITFNNALAHQIYAGSDMFLMPSYFEPCGLGQLIAMRYGALPIVRHTGGLIDTISDLTPDLAQGNGFVFRDYTPEALIAIVNRAINAFGNRQVWYKAVQRVMNLDFSWQASAKKYDKLYRYARDKRK